MVLVNPAENQLAAPNPRTATLIPHTVLGALQAAVDSPIRESNLHLIENKQLHESIFASYSPIEAFKEPLLSPFSRIYAIILAPYRLPSLRPRMALASLPFSTSAVTSPLALSSLPPRKALASLPSSTSTVTSPLALSPLSPGKAPASVGPCFVTKLVFPTHFAPARSLPQSATPPVPFAAGSAQAGGVVLQLVLRPNPTPRAPYNKRLARGGDL